MTASGVLPGAECVSADNGTIVSWLVLTAAADEALLRPVAARALVAALRAELEAIEAAVVVVVVLDELVLAVVLVLPDVLPVVVAVLLPAVVAAPTVPTTAFEV